MASPASGRRPTRLVGWIATAAIVALSGCGSSASRVSSSGAAGNGSDAAIVEAATAFGNAYWHADYAKAMHYAVPEQRQVLQALENLDSATSVTSDDVHVADVERQGTTATFTYVGTFCGATSSPETQVASGEASGGQAGTSTSIGTSTVMSSGSAGSKTCVVNKANSTNPNFRFGAVQDPSSGRWLVRIGTS